GSEVAFAGLSNAGKSSALNTITDNGSLARTSKTPGRTQMINYFQIDAERRLVDLPGYGFAKVPVAVKKHWQGVLEGYFADRQSLKGVVLLMDIRHPMKPFDDMMLSWCQQSGVKAHILLTKADKLKSGAAKSSVLKVRKVIKELGLSATVQSFSATKKDGVEQARGLLDEWLGFGEGVEE
ncbi:MAG: ribosome biogenesis GTP-binding protein YihA/YsxC, partial [Gammaproteobacteria bacterium]|nr:ribosome biogenesis GTP-binding protein YihA/YsxC [Gammaproteobacteria bacterium]